MCPPGLVPIPHSSPSAPAPPTFFCFSFIVSAENYATIFLLCWETLCIVGSSTRPANKGKPVSHSTHAHTHSPSITYSPSLSVALSLSLFLCPCLTLSLVLSAGKSKHFKLSILRVTCGISSAQTHECSKLSWQGAGAGLLPLPRLSSQHLI